MIISVYGGKMVARKKVSMLVIYGIAAPLGHLFGNKLLLKIWKN
nr:MAG TPA: hypothetical protein [Caudoviricetes sp.]